MTVVVTAVVEAERAVDGLLLISGMINEGVPILTVLLSLLLLLWVDELCSLEIVCP